MAQAELFADEYKVNLEVFEGPLDLLLFLIRREELDIYDIPIAHIATEYMKYLEIMRNLNLDVAGEFVVMAATLMGIKSRMLLPVTRRQAEEGEDEDWQDPRLDLVRQLIEYKKFKDADNKVDDATDLMESLKKQILNLESEKTAMQRELDDYKRAVTTLENKVKTLGNK